MHGETVKLVLPDFTQHFYGFTASDKFLLISSVKILTCSQLSALVGIMMQRIC